MTYEEFIRVSHDRLTERYAAEGWSVRLYHEGDVGRDFHEQCFINTTNLRYYGHESDELGGDFFEFIEGPGLESSVICRFEAGCMYELFLSGGWSEVFGAVDKNVRSSIDSVDIAEHIGDYDFIKNRLIVKLLNYERNKEALEGKVYRRVADFAMVLYCLVSRNEFDCLSFKIDKDRLDEWGVSESDAIDNALANTCSLFPPRVYYTIPALARQRYSVGAFMNPSDAADSEIDLEMGIFTGFGYSHGATSFFYPGISDSICDRVGSKDYFVLFTSIADYRICTSQDADVDRLKKCLHHINSISEDDEMLTEEVLRFDAWEKELIF